MNGKSARDLFDIVLGKQGGEVWKIPRIPPRASPSEEYSEFPDFSLFTQDYISLI